MARFNYNKQQQNQQQFRRDDFLLYPLDFYNAALEHVWTATPHMVNEFRLGLNRNDLARRNSTYDTDPTKSYITIPGAFTRRAGCRTRIPKEIPYPAGPVATM